MLGAGGELQRAEARMDGGDWRVSERWRDLYWLHHAGVSGQVHAVHGRAAGRKSIERSGERVRACDSGAAGVYAGGGEQGTEVAASADGVDHGVSSAVVLMRPY